MSEERVCEVCQSLSPVSSFRYGITSNINASCFTCYNVRRVKILSNARRLVRLFEDEYLGEGFKAFIRERRKYKKPAKRDPLKPKRIILCRSENRELSREEQIDIYINQLRGLAVGDHVVAVNINMVMRCQIAAAMKILGRREFREVRMSIPRRRVNGEVCSNESKIWRTK